VTDFADSRFAIIAADFYADLAERLTAGARACLTEAGVELIDESARLYVARPITTTLSVQNPRGESSMLVLKPAFRAALAC